MKLRILLLISAFIAFLLSSVASAREAGTRIEGDIFVGIEEVGIVAEELEPGFGFTAESIRNYIHTLLKAKIPSLKISTVSYPYIHEIMYCMEKSDHPQNTCAIEVALRRIVYLPDKKTFVIATVWNRARLFQGAATFSKVKEQLNVLLQAFADDFMHAEKKHMPRPAP